MVLLMEILLEYPWNLGFKSINLTKCVTVLLGVCSWITHFIKIFQCVLLSKATFLGGGGEGSGDCLMQNLPWKSWGTSHDWRQDLHSDSLMHFTLWWHCMLHSSWKRAYIRSLSSFFLSLISWFFFFFYSHIRSQEGTHLWRGVNFATWEGRFGYLPWDDSLNHLSYLRVLYWKCFV